MSRSWWGKCFLLVFLVIMSGIYVFPTLANLDLEKTKFPFKQKMNLGLDLQGGLYLVLGIDFNKVYRDVIERQASSLKDRLNQKGISVTGMKRLREGFSPDDPRVTLDFEESKRSEFYQILKKRQLNTGSCGICRK